MRRCILITFSILLLLSFSIYTLLLFIYGIYFLYVINKCGNDYMRSLYDQYIVIIVFDFFSIYICGTLSYLQYLYNGIK